MGSIKEGTIAQVSYGRHRNHSVLIVEDRRDNPLAFIGGENNYSVIFISGDKAVIHLKPLGDPHQNCTQFDGGRNRGLIVKRPLNDFVR